MKSGVTKYYGSAKKKKLANMAIAVLAIIAIIIILITIYGQNVGNFVVAIETSSQLSLSLSETAGFEDPKSRLAAKGVKNQTHATYSDITKDIAIVTRDGSNNDPGRRYFAYTFYVKNASATVLNYRMIMTLNHTTLGAEAALRVMVIKNDESTMYAKPKNSSAGGNVIKEDLTDTDILVNYPVENFISSVTLLQQTELNFTRNSVNRYTIVMWLEGYDPECTDDIKGAIMRMELHFEAYQV